VALFNSEHVPVKSCAIIKQPKIWVIRYVTCFQQNLGHMVCHIFQQNNALNYSDLAYKYLNIAHTQLGV